MAGEISPLEPGLHLVATPIGNARDITLRALDILAAADVLAAEDTRSLRRLMDIHGIELGGRRILPYHDHNGPAMRPRLMAELAAGRSIAYASEAGTPLVADPGFRLAREAVDAGHTLRVAPGPSAVLAALAVSGLPTDRFLFAGFAPAQGGARRAFLADLRNVPATVVLFESPKRVNRLLGELCESWSGQRQAAICRELTKRFEEVQRGSLAELACALAQRSLKGEVVIVIDRDRGATDTAEAGLAAALRAALADAPLRDAVDRVAAETGLPRRQVYQTALTLQRDMGEDGD